MSRLVQGCYSISTYVGFLVVFVDDTAGEYMIHLGSVDGLSIAKGTWENLVATVFGEEHWHLDILHQVGQLLVGGSLVLVVTAPSVAVDSVVVGMTFIVGGTGEVLSEILTELNDVGGGVTNWDFTETMGLGVLPHVSLDGTHVWSSHVHVLWLVGKLVSGEVGNDVGVGRELLHDLEDVLHVDVVIGGPWLVTVNGIPPSRSIDVKNNVDTSSVEEGHALVVVEGGVDGICSDGVDTELLEQVDITLALLKVGERIESLIQFDWAVGLVADTDKVELQRWRGAQVSFSRFGIRIQHRNWRIRGSHTGSLPA